MNTLAYGLYFFITGWVTIYTGWIFYRNGFLYLLALLHDKPLTLFVNRLLLTGYYLVNLGYVVLTIRYWKTIDSLSALTASIVCGTGTIMFILAIIHFCNMAVIYYLSKHKRPHFIHP